MRRSLSLLALFAMMLALCPNVHGQLFVKNVSKVGITAAPFLEIGVGARAVGMGGAFVATSDDATALYWNPGGLVRLKRSEVIFVHTQWLADFNFDYAGAVIPLGSFGTLGGSVTSFTTSDMAVRTVERPEGTGEFFSVGDLAIGLSYSRALTDRFSIGFTAKYIHQRLWHMTAQGFALDVGTLFVTGFKGLRIGAALTNFGTDLRLNGKDVLVYHDIDPNKLGNNDQVFARLNTDSWPLPLSFQFGLAMDVLEDRNTRLTLAVDALHPSDNFESLNVGGEFALWNTLFVRAGYKDLLLKDGEQNVTLGAGIARRFLQNVRVKLDYAYADFGRLENVQRFSLGIEF